MRSMPDRILIVHEQSPDEARRTHAAISPQVPEEQTPQGMTLATFRRLRSVRAYDVTVYLEDREATLTCVKDSAARGWGYVRYAGPVEDNEGSPVRPHRVWMCPTTVHRVEDLLRAFLADNQGWPWPEEGPAPTRYDLLNER